MRKPNVTLNETWAHLLSPPRAPEEIGRLAHFRILGVLGDGGMGVVFRAEDVHLKRLVALKITRPKHTGDPQILSRFLREARAAAALKHDNIVTIYHVGQDHGVLYLAMEYLTGRSLDALIANGRRLSMTQVMRIGREIARGLQAAHDRGMVHRDIKPSNIWLEAPKGRVKLLDFGLALSGSDEVSLTQSGTVVGTPYYMAPEQADGLPVDGRSDLFSLGCLLYQLSTGELPFRGDTMMAVLKAIASHQPVPPSQLNPEVPPPLEELILQLMAKRREDRPVSAGEVARLLSNAAGSAVEGAAVETRGGESALTKADLAPAEVVPVDAGKTALATSPERPRLRLLLLTAAGLTVLVPGYILLQSRGRRQNSLLSTSTQGPALLRRLVFADLEDEPAQWHSWAEGRPNAEITAMEVDGGQVLRCSLKGGVPYSNAHFYRNITTAKSSAAPCRVALSLAFRFSSTTYNNEGGVPSSIQAIEFTTSQWRNGTRSELALQWLNVGEGAPRWRYWDPTGNELWHPLPIVDRLEPDRWHTLRLDGVWQDDAVTYTSFCIDGRMHPLSVVVATSREPDVPDKLAVGVQLDGNALQSPFHVDLDTVSLSINAE